MSWLDSLAAAKKKPDYLDPNAPEDIENAAERTAEAAFGIATNEETSRESIQKSAVQIADKRERDLQLQHVNEIKSKLAIRNIDPVGLGVVKKEEWDGASDPEWTETIAKASALAFEKQQRTAWEKQSMEPQAKMSFDPAVSKAGKVMSSGGHKEDSVPQVTRVPANQASILDPSRIDRLASEPTEHDKSINEIRAQKEKSVQEKKKETEDRVAALKDFDPLAGGKISPSGSKETDAFIHRVPSNQVSIMDNLKPADGQNVNDLMKSLFKSRIEDTRESIRDSRTQLQERLQGKKQKEEVLTEVKKPISSSELSKRLVDMLLPQKPNKDEKESEAK